MKENYWQNKTAVVTGGSSGIGEALVRKLSSVKCRIINVDRNPASVSSDKAEIHSVICDLSVPDSVEKASAEIAKLTDRIDFLFNNAGITTHGRFDHMNVQVFRKTFEVNFFGTIHLTSGLLPLVKKAKGAIMVTSTVSGLYGIPGRSAYSSSKSALHAVFESLRIELSEEGIRSIIFCPPYTKTNLRTSGLDAKGEKLQEEQAKGKIKTPEEVAEEMIKAMENPNSRLVTMDKSGIVVKWLRLFAPAFLEKILFKKLYNDFH